MKQVGFVVSLASAYNLSVSLLSLSFYVSLCDCLIVSCQSHIFSLHVGKIEVALSLQPTKV